MDITEKIKQDAEKLGIALAHYDIDGHFIQANPDSLSYFIHLLQPPSQADLPESFDDVLVAVENEPIFYAVNMLNISENTQLDFRLLNENQKVIFHQSSLSSSISLPSLTFGYYCLEILTEKCRYRVRLLVRPQTVYQPAVLSEKKAWGINIQLYSLRSERNWGIGDFGDLDYLIRQSAQFGVDFIGINPLHQLYSSVPEWASPYSSSSRHWLNHMYLAIDCLPEFKFCKSVQNWFNAADIQEKVTTLRNSELVNYTEVSQLKLTALEQLFAYFKRAKSVQIIKRRQEFNAFLTEQGEKLLSQALFDVLDTIERKQQPRDENNIGWLGWRKEWQQLHAKQRQVLLAEHKDKVEFYAWLQWLCDVQLRELKQQCQQAGIALGIYGDLAVSSSRGSADVWSDSSLYCIDASVGAPPDPLGPVGQNWNIPPYNPSVLKARGFQPFIDMLRANMQYFGVLRIDHIMGLFRLWLIPKNKTAADGVYVHYPFAELMAVLAIESQRNRCLIVGEDLGTVPNEVRSALNEFHIFSYFVLYFEQREQQYPKVNEFPLNAFATVGTHDVPSLQSFWHCKDLQLFGELGVLQGEILKEKYDQRVQDKQALLNTLHRDHYLPENYAGDALSMAMHEYLNRQIHQYLAESQTRLIGVQLENLLCQEVSFNLPGTSDEYPNWRKKLAYTLENLFEHDYIPSFLSQINQARTK